MKVYVKGEGEVSLSKADFVAAGGEASIYAKAGRTYKLYTDPSRMVPVDKIRELAQITDPNVIKPEKVVVDKRGKPLGFTMRFIRDALALCQLFPRAFRDRNGITPDMTLDLVRRLQAGVQHVHDAGVLIVDLNEMNFLVDPAFREVFFIDVDSYQTAHYPATALMTSVRDWTIHNNDWTELSDWFSFAVVSFQLFVGLHPYKGKHPSLRGFEERMKANASVFDPAVQMPKAAYPLDVIPPIYRAWYEAVLEQGKRMPPPTDLRGVLVVTPVVRQVAGTNNLLIAEVHEYTGTVLGFIEHDGRSVVWTNEAVFMDNRRVGDAIKGIRGVGFSPRMNRPIIAGMSVSENRLLLYDVAIKTAVPIDLRADEVMAYGGTVYVRSRDKILRVVLTDAGQKVVASTAVAATCLEHATRLYPGVAIQSLLGRTYTTIFPRAGASYPVPMPELDDYRVVEAKFDKGVFMVLGMKAGHYDRLVFRFDHNFNSYDLRVVSDVTPAGLNFITLDTGICVCMAEDDSLEVFSSRKGSTGMKRVDDPMLGGDMQLMNRGGQVVFPRGNKLFSMAMR